MDRITKRGLWEQRIADSKSSGQAVRDWCNANSLSINTFRYWFNKADKDHSTAFESNTPVTPTHWIKVDSINNKHESDSALVITIGKASVQVTPGFDPEFLKEVLRTLSSVC